VTHEQGDGQKEGQQEETGQDAVGEAGGEKGKKGEQAISSVMAANHSVRSSLHRTANVTVGGEVVIRTETAVSTSLETTGEP
jgi:hypothetical protein